MRFWKKAWLGMLVGLLASVAVARQDPAPVRQAVMDFLRIQTQGLPGRASFEVRDLDAANNLQACAALEAYLPTGARPWGRTAVGVRCVAGANWSIYIQAQVRVVGDYLVTARTLGQGQVVGTGDVLVQSGDLTDLPAGVVTDPGLAVGRTLLMSIASGRPLRSDMLRQPAAVQQGQGVKVVSRGNGFAVSAEGRALNTAAEGQVAQVRLPSGQVLSGIARAGGVVEVGF